MNGKWLPTVWPILKRIMFLAALVLLILALSGRIDLTSPFFYYVGGKCLDQYDILGNLCHDTPIELYIEWGKVLLFALSIVVGMMIWSFIDQYQKQRQK
ncbi:MAG: hypothetical protein V1926_05415 [Candidatus Peregrinibacteria bacterium]